MSSQAISCGELFRHQKSFPDTSSVLDTLHDSFNNEQVDLAVEVN